MTGVQTCALPISLPQAARRHDIAGAHLIVADNSASRVTPVERQGRPTTLPNWIVLIEGFTFDAIRAVGDSWLSDERLQAHGAKPGIERDDYTLQFTLLSSPAGNRVAN